MKSNLSGILAPLASSYPDIMDAIATKPNWNSRALSRQWSLTHVVCMLFGNSFHTNSHLFSSV